MFCTTLRQRPEWAPIIPVLLRSETPKYREKPLNTHDLTLLLPRARTPADVFRLLCLAATDFTPPYIDITNTKIDRLATLSGGQNISVLFLINQGSQSIDGMQAYLRLQAYLIEQSLSIPIIPLSTLTSLSRTLLEFSLALAQEHTQVPAPSAFTDILPYCSTSPPLSQYARDVLLSLVPNLGSLVTAATDENGRDAIRQAMGPERGGDAVDIIEFWSTEFVNE